MKFIEALVLAEETAPEILANFISIKYKNGFYENRNVNNILNNIKKEIINNKNNFDINGQKVKMTKDYFLNVYLKNIKNNLNLKDEITKEKVNNQLECFKQEVLKFLL